MVEKIRWRKKALQFVRENAQYLEQEFSRQAADNFVDAVTKAIEKAAKNSGTYRKATKTKSVHYLNVDKIGRCFTVFREKHSLFQLFLIPDKTQRKARFNSETPCKHTFYKAFCRFY